MHAIVWMTAALALFLMPSAQVYSAETAPAESGGGIVWSKQCQGLLVGVPDGWVLDNRLAAAQGIDMLFYPTAARKQDGRVDLSLMIYVMPTVKQDNGTSVSTNDLIAEAQVNLRSQDPAAQWQVEAPVPAAAGGLQLTTAQFEAARMPLFEEVTYLEDKDVIFAIVLAARSPSQRLENAGMTQSMARAASIPVSQQSSPPCPVLHFPSATP